jgi:hypothetical protein
VGKNKIKKKNKKKNNNKRNTSKCNRHSYLVNHHPKSNKKREKQIEPLLSYALFLSRQMPSTLKIGQAHFFII